MIHSMLYQPQHSPWLKGIATFFNLLVLIGSMLIIGMLSLEILYPDSYGKSPLFVRTKLWICIAFLCDIVVRFVRSSQKIRFALRNCLFFVISIPYLTLIELSGLSLSPLGYLFLHGMMLLRGAYGLVVVVSWITTSKLSNLLFSYLSILLASTYFASLVVYEIEQGINSQINSYSDAIWWACMDVTAVGSSITPITAMGRIISVILALLGMCLFPIVTAYITDRFSNKTSTKQPNQD